MRILYLFLCLLLPWPLLAQNQIPQISELASSFSFANNRLTIGFDLSDAENDSLEVRLLVSTDEGLNYDQDVSGAFGDVGFPVLPGPGKAIYWDAPGAIFSPLMRVKIVVDDREPLAIQELVDQVDSTRLQQDLQYFGQPRHRNQHPQLIAEIIDSMRFRLEEQGLRVREQVQVYQGYDQTNVIGRKQGYRNEKQTYIVDAHFDAVFNTPGADDNGSGTVAMLETARVLAPYVSEKSIQFIGFDLEEEGLLGSIDFLTAGGGQLASDTLQGVFNYEMVGYFDNQPNTQALPLGFNLLFPAAYNAIAADSFRGNFLVNVGNAASSPLVQAFDSAAAKYVPALKVISVAVPGNGQSAPDLRRSDHASFWDAGYQALMLTDGADFRNPHYHTANDTIGALHFTFMRQNVQAVVATLAELAVFRHASEAVTEVSLQNVGIEKLEEICAIHHYQQKRTITVELDPLACALKNARLSLIDMEGKFVRRGENQQTPSRLQISTADLSRGIYVLLLESEQGFFSTKVLIP